MAKLIPGINDLGTINPELAAEWHPTRNGTLKPEMVTYGSTKKVWWRGRVCGHEWDAIIADRHRGSGCPFCSNRRVLVGFNDLATTNSDLAAEWHPTRNGTLTPEKITCGSRKKVWWRGIVCGHEWDAIIADRHNGSRCPFCSNKKVLAGFNDLATINSDLAAEWHPTRNGTLTPEMVTYGSAKKVWWLCPFGHEWKATINDRQKYGCPVCDSKVILAGDNDLATKDPELAAEWHPEKNGALMPTEVAIFSNKKVWWLCPFGHEWEAVIADRQRFGCPVCNNKIVEPGHNDLATKNPSLAAEWHPGKNGDITPDMVTSCSDQKVWWLGPCGHDWPAAISSRNRGRGCPICDNKVVKPGYNDLATRNPSLAAEWHPEKNGDITPDMVTSGSDQKVWWLGPCGHEWAAIIKDRNHGSGCPHCKGLHRYSKRFVI